MYREMQPEYMGSVERIVNVQKCYCLIVLILTKTTQCFGMFSRTWNMFL